MPEGPIDAQEAAKQLFRKLAERLCSATDDVELTTIKNELARMTFAECVQIDRSDLPPELRDHLF